MRHISFNNLQKAEIYKLQTSIKVLRALIAYGLEDQIKYFCQKHGLEFVEDEYFKDKRYEEHTSFLDELLWFSSMEYEELSTKKIILYEKDSENITDYLSGLPLDKKYKITIEEINHEKN